MLRYLPGGIPCTVIFGELSRAAVEEALGVGVVAGRSLLILAITPPVMSREGSERRMQDTPAIAGPDSSIGRIAPFLFAMSAPAGCLRRIRRLQGFM